MKLLVTGGAGFIGSHFIRQWLNEHVGDEIINLDALTYAGCRESLSDLESNSRYQFVQGNICDEALVEKLVKGVDTIVHFAAETHVDRSIVSSREFIQTNIDGVRVLLEAVRHQEKPPRFHHVSTDEVFGSLSLNDPKFTEKTPYDPRSPYSASKAAADHLVRAYFHTYGLPVTISNCSNNYGPYQFPEKLIPRSVSNLLDNKKIAIYGTGENIRDWIYVADHVEGIMKILDKGVIGETYCLGGNNEITNIEIARQLLSLLGKDEIMIEYVGDRPGHDFRYAIDSSRAERELGWKPKTDFSKGLAMTVEWYKANEVWWRPLLKNI